MTKKVVILGGGVAGLSAAHELIERGFEVQVFEKRGIAGGKARSVSVPGTGKDGRRDLPGEHGFRFFPRFYKHLPDTMSRIPFGSGTCADNLVETTRLEYPRIGKSPIVMIDRFPRSFDDWKLAFQDAFTDFGFKPGEQDYFAERLWQYITTCTPRREDEYERLAWWDYIGAKTRSEAYQKYLAGGLTRSLNAAKAQKASTRTIGAILVQLLFDVIAPGLSSDRLLNGPTNDVWINPWVTYLRARGVQYNMHTDFVSIQCDGGKITGVTLQADGKTFDVTADYYLIAVPLEVMATKLTDDLLAADPTLQGIATIRDDVQWMNGIQFYLKEDVPLVHGHELYVDSAWALTSISQAQFWQSLNLPQQFGDGTVRGVLSVDISEWDVAGSKEHADGKPANQCTRDQIAEETWFQLKQSLNNGQQTVLTDNMLHSWYLDRDIEPGKSRAELLETDAEPLLVNYVNSWDFRPNAHTRIPNLFLAADYVRTYTDLACMEGANEAARRAVNCIIDASGSKAPLCKLWNLHEWELFAPWKMHDQKRYDEGLPWDGKLDLGSEIRAMFKL